MTSAITARDYQNLIDGAWVDAADGRDVRAGEPGARRRRRPVPEGGEEDLDRRSPPPAARSTRAPGRMMPGVERARILNRVAEAHPRRRGRPRATWRRSRAASRSRRRATRSMSSADLWEYAATLCRHTYGDTYNTLGAGHVRHGPARAGRRRRHDHALELPAADHQPEAAVRPRRRLHGGRQARGDHAGDDAAPGARSAQEAGLPGRRAQRRHRLRAARRRAAGGAPGRRHDPLHRLDRRRPAGHRGLGGNLKKVELELGGKNPQIVFADADLEAALDAVVFGVYFNMGECCNSGSRLLVQRSIADEFIAAVVERAEDRPGRRSARSRDQGRRDRHRRAVRQDRRARRRRPRRGRRPAPRRRAPRDRAGPLHGRRPCSPASARRCGSRARRSSARSCRC